MMNLHKILFIIFSYILISSCFALAEEEPGIGSRINVSGVFPHLAMVADHSPRTEAGTGAMVPWAGRLWIVTYVAHMKGTGSGTGLYEIDENLNLRKRPESVVGTYANRMIHTESQQLIIGPHLIDTDGNVRTIDGVKEHRLTVTMRHLTEPERKVYFLAMEGELFEVDVHTMETKFLFNLLDELNVPKEAKPHFKGGFTAHGRVVVANNTYDERDYNESWRRDVSAPGMENNGPWSMQILIQKSGVRNRSAMPYSQPVGIISRLFSKFIHITNGPPTVCRKRAIHSIKPAARSGCGFEKWKPNAH